MELDDGGQSLNIVTIVNLHPLIIHDVATLRVGRRGVHQLNCSIRLCILDGEGAKPLRSELPREELESGVEQQDVHFKLEVFLHKLSIMIGFYL